MGCHNKVCFVFSLSLLKCLKIKSSVYDSDGEFLLIEAAEALPSWVKPSNSENRVRSFVCNVEY